MNFNTSLVLWFVMLIMLVQLAPKPTGWGKVATWAALVLLTVVLILVKAIHFT